MPGWLCRRVVLWVGSPGRHQSWLVASGCGCQGSQRQEGSKARPQEDRLEPMDGPPRASRSLGGRVVTRHIQSPQESDCGTHGHCRARSRPGSPVTRGMADPPEAAAEGRGHSSGCPRQCRPGGRGACRAGLTSDRGPDMSSIIMVQNQFPSSSRWIIVMDFDLMQFFSGAPEGCAGRRWCRLRPCVE